MREYNKKEGDKIGMGPLHSPERCTLVRCPQSHYTSPILSHPGKMHCCYVEGYR